MSINLSIVIASTRPGRVGPVISKWVESASRDSGNFDVNVLDLADFNLPLLDESAHPRLQQYAHEHTKRWSAAVAASDAFIFVTPEYDSFPPAAVINALQYLSLEWNYKVAAVVSYGGVSGGLRASQELRMLLANLNMMPIAQSVPIPFFPKQINDEKQFVPTEPMSDGLKLVLAELHKWAQALKLLRSA